MGFLRRLFQKESPAKHIHSLQHMLSNATLNDRGIFVAYATWIRAGLEVEDVLPQDPTLKAEMDSNPNPTVYDAWMQFRLEKEKKIARKTTPKAKRILAKDLNPLFHAPRETIPRMLQLIRLFNKEKQTEKAAVLSLWCSSLRGLLHEEYQPLVKQLWDILMPSQPYWEKAMDKIAKEDKNAGMPEDLLQEVYIHAKNILTYLPPQRANNAWEKTA